VAPEGPTANFDCNNTGPLQLTCTAAEDGASYSWESEGQTRTEKSVTFDYDTPGSKEVSLTVTKNGQDASAQASFDVPPVEGGGGGDDAASVESRRHWQ
jgi:PKD repeat protein